MTTATTSYRGRVEPDFAGLDTLLKDAGQKDRVAREVFGRGDSDPDPDDLLMEADGRSLPDSVALWTIFWRVTRTMGPILVADIVAAILTALFARTVLAFFFGASASAWAAPLALLPLFIAWWLGGLYSQIWVHPAVELKQLTHVTTVVLLSAMAGGLVTQSWPLALWCLAAWPAAVALVPLMRNVARRLCANRQWWGYPTLVIGAGAAGDAIARALVRDSNSGLRPVLLTDPKGECRLSSTLGS